MGKTSNGKFNFHMLCSKGKNIWEKYAQELVMGCALVCVLCVITNITVIATETVEIQLQLRPALNDDLTHWHLFGVMCINSSSQWHGILFILMALTLDGTLLVIKWLLYFQRKQDNHMLCYVTSANLHRLGQIGGGGVGAWSQLNKKKAFLKS